MRYTSPRSLSTTLLTVTIERQRVLVTKAERLDSSILETGRHSWLSDDVTVSETCTRHLSHHLFAP